MSSQKAIAVFSHNKPFFGATLVQFPLYQHLRKNYPDHIIKVYSPVQEADLFIKYGLADELEVYQKSAFRNYWTLPRSIKKLRPAIIINCREFSEQINIIVGLSKAPQKIGFKPNSITRAFYNRTIPYSISTYRGSNFLNLVYLLDLKKRFEFDEIKTLGNASSLQFDIHRKNICLIPGGGEGEHKRWGIQNFLALCQRYLAREKNTCFNFILGFKEEEYIEEIKKTLPAENINILFKIQIGDMVKAILQSNVTVANDCGPSHLAQMCKVNYISIWGWEKQQPYERIGEWFLPHAKAAYVVAEKDQSIKTVAAEKVLPILTEMAAGPGR
jgi:ADP-heptose:LPS heptosyltransferase